MREYFRYIDDVLLREQYERFYDQHREKFESVCAGAKHHHWWEGGLKQHCEEMCQMGLQMMRANPEHFPFTKADFVISVFLHDFAKIWRYRKITEEDRKRDRWLHPQQVFCNDKDYKPLCDDENLTLLELSRQGITPSNVQWSAVLFAEGGFASAHYEFGGTSRIGSYINSQNPLVVLLHICDLYSSQLLGKGIA